MHAIRIIMRKELADHFSSYRFMILFALIAMVSLITSYLVGLNIQKELEGISKPRFVFLMLFTSSGALFSLKQFVAFFGPLIGLLLGFDAINREKNEGTMSKLLAQPIFRDAVINGKFLAGVVTISVMLTAIVLVVSGLGLRVIGVVPGAEEVVRLFVFWIISILYISFWLGVAILFSILFRSVATSALAALAVWIFFSFFISLGAATLASAFAPDTAGDSQALLRRARIEKTVSLLSPMELYSDSTATIVNPMRRTTRSLIQMGMMEQLSMQRFSGPLPLSQSVLVVLPHIVSLTAVTLLCFAVSFTVFMRQEIRSL